MFKRIFISYRREDSKADARSIYQRLERKFGASSLFMDVDTIQAGSDFTKVLDDHLAASGVVLALVGKRWLESKDEHGARRLDNPEDFVRLEVARALARGIPVIPVLLDGASMPRAADLPEDLKEITKRHAAIVTHETFSRDIQALERAVERLLRPRSWLALSASVFAAGILMAAGYRLFLAQPSGAPETVDLINNRTWIHEMDRRLAAALKAKENKAEEVRWGLWSDCTLGSEEGAELNCLWKVTAPPGDKRYFNINFGEMIELTPTRIVLTPYGPDSQRSSIGAIIDKQYATIAIGQEYPLVSHGGGSCSIALLAIEEERAGFELRC